jgi:hypothetical protein
MKAVAFDKNCDEYSLLAEYVKHMRPQGFLDLWMSFANRDIVNYLVAYARLIARTGEDNSNISVSREFVFMEWSRLRNDPRTADGPVEFLQAVSLIMGKKFTMYKRPPWGSLRVCALDMLDRIIARSMPPPVTWLSDETAKDPELLHLLSVTLALISNDLKFVQTPPSRRFAFCRSLCPPVLQPMD